MKIIEINKYKKKIKLIKHPTNFEIKGPLGTMYFKYSQLGSNSKNIFINKDSLIFFVNKIKKLFRSVSTG